MIVISPAINVKVHERGIFSLEATLAGASFASYPFSMSFLRTSLSVLLALLSATWAADKKNSKEPVIAAVDTQGGTITIATDGDFTTYSARPPLEVTVNKARATLKDLEPGMKVTFTLSDRTKISRIAASGLPSAAVTPKGTSSSNLAPPPKVTPPDSKPVVAAADRAGIEPSGGKVAAIEVGKPQFSDRNFKWDERRLPEFTRGWNYVLGSIKGGEATCTKTGTVYFLTHAREPNTWGDSLEDDFRAKGFGRVATVRYGDGPGNVYAVLTKRVQSGEKLSWGRFGVLIF